MSDTAEGEPADSSGTTGVSDASSGSGSSGVSDQSGISGQSGGAGSSSSESSGSSDGNAASGSAGSSGSSHVHEWAVQTTTVHHAPVYKTIHHDAVMEERHICNGAAQISPAANQLISRKTYSMAAADGIMHVYSTGGI